MWTTVIQWEGRGGTTSNSNSNWEKCALLCLEILCGDCNSKTKIVRIRIYFLNSFVFHFKIRISLEMLTLLPVIYLLRSSWLSKECIFRSWNSNLIFWISPSPFNQLLEYLALFCVLLILFGSTRNYSNTIFLWILSLPMAYASFWRLDSKWSWT